jgi:hypothetical protein
VARKKAVLDALVARFFASTDALYPVVPLMGTVRNEVAPQRINELSAGLAQCRVSTNLLNVMPDGNIYAARTGCTPRPAARRRGR